jgi:hypothetical protein
VITSKFLAENNEEKKSKKKLTSFFSKKMLKKVEVKEEYYKDIIAKEESKKEGKKEDETKGNHKKEEEKNKEQITMPTVQTEENAQHLKTNNSIIETTNKNNTSFESNYNIGNINNYFNLIIEQKCFIAIVTFTDLEKSVSNQYTIHFNYAHFSKFKLMEKYMKNTSFLLKFIDINYTNATIKFDYESLNTFDEKKWIKEVEKYNCKFVFKPRSEDKDLNKEEQKVGAPISNTIHKAEYAGAIKGTTITIETKAPIILLRTINKLGKITTNTINIFEEEEQKLNLNKNINFLNLAKNIVDISLKHKKKEIEEKK